MTDTLLHLLRWALKVPTEFLGDPSKIYAGTDGKGQPADPQLKVAAEFADRLHFEKRGKFMPLNALANNVAQVLDLAKPPSRASVREWTKEWRVEAPDA